MTEQPGRKDHELEPGRKLSGKLVSAGDDAKQGSKSIATLMYLMVQFVSRMAVVLEVDVPWGLLKELFGWLDFSTLPLIYLPNASEVTQLGLAVALPAFVQGALAARLAFLFMMPSGGWAPRTRPLGGDRWDRRLPSKILVDACVWAHLRGRSVFMASAFFTVAMFLVGLTVSGFVWLAGAGIFILCPLLWTVLVALARRRWWRIVTTLFEENDRAVVYWGSAVDNEVQVLGSCTSPSSQFVIPLRCCGAGTRLLIPLQLLGFLQRSCHSPRFRRWLLWHIFMARNGISASAPLVGVGCRA